eukprot:Awhi_evm1s5154
MPPVLTRNQQPQIDLTESEPSDVEENMNRIELNQGAGQNDENRVAHNEMKNLVTYLKIFEKIKTFSGDKYEYEKWKEDVEDSLTFME